VGEAIGSNRIGGTVYELPPGESAWPYHYEVGDEEWLLVLDGRVSRAHAGGEGGSSAPATSSASSRVPRERTRWSTRDDRDGARPHAAQTRRWPAVAVYPDSQKVGVFGDDPGRADHGPPRERRPTTGTVSADAWGGARAAGVERRS
jgi:hypothetical protein